MNSPVPPPVSMPSALPQPPTWRSLDEARALLEEELSCFLRTVAAGNGEGQTLAIRATAGLGKTRTLLRLLGETAVALLAIGHIQIMVPTHDLAEEVHAEFRRLFPELPSMVLRGRDATNPDTGEPMCLKSDLAKPLGEICGNVTEALCQIWDAEEKRMRRSLCRRACPWHEQIPTRPTVVFLPHAYLTAGVPIPGNVALRVIDEKFFTGLLTENNVSLGNWLPKRDPMSPATELDLRMDRAREVVFNALRIGGPVNDCLRAEGYDSCEIEGFRARELATAPTLSIHPQMLPEDQRKALAGFDLMGQRVARVRARVWQAICGSWDRPCSERLTLDETTTAEGVRQSIWVHRRKPTNQLISTILIDADADPLIVETVRPGARFVSLSVAPRAEIVQVGDRTFSNASLLSRTGAEELRKDVLLIVEREVARAEGRGVLLVTTQAVLERLHRDVDPTSELARPEDLMRPLLGAEPRWYGPRLQGVNTYRDFETVILVGRLEPPVSAIDAQLRALAADSEAPLVFAVDRTAAPGWFPEARGWYLRPNGSFEPAKVRHHPDPRGAALLAQNREAHLLQAMARTRAVGADGRKRIVILCSIPLPEVPVDKLVSWTEFVTGIPADLTRKVALLRRAIRRPDGRLEENLRLSVHGLVDDAPHVFYTESMAREWRRGLPSDRLRDILNYVECLDGVRTTLSTSRRAGGGRGTPIVTITDAAFDSVLSRDHALQAPKATYPNTQPRHYSSPPNSATYSETGVTPETSSRSRARVHAT